MQLCTQKTEEHVRFLCHYLVPFKQCSWSNQNPTSHVCWPANPSKLPVFAPTSEVTGIYGHTQLLHGCWDGYPPELPLQSYNADFDHSKCGLLDFTTEKFPFLPLLLNNYTWKVLQKSCFSYLHPFFSSIPNCCVSALLGYAIVQTLHCCDSILYF